VSDEFIGGRKNLTVKFCYEKGPKYARILRIFMQQRNKISNKMLYMTDPSVYSVLHGSGAMVPRPLGKVNTMIKRRRVAAETAPVVEQAVELPVVEQVQAEPVVEQAQHPVLALPSIQPTTPEAKVGKAKYVAKFWKADWVITVLRPNPKRGQCAGRYELHVPGQTVAEYTELVVARGKRGFKGETAALANLDLRWGMARGFYSIDPPAAKQED